MGSGLSVERSLLSYLILSFWCYHDSKNDSSSWCECECLDIGSTRIPLTGVLPDLSVGLSDGLRSRNYMTVLQVALVLLVSRLARAQKSSLQDARPPVITDPLDNDSCNQH